MLVFRPIGQYTNLRLRMYETLLGWVCSGICSAQYVWISITCSLVSISHELFANVARISPGYNMQLLGCLPTAESTLYEGPITLSETTVVKAIAKIISHHPIG